MVELWENRETKLKRAVKIVPVDRVQGNQQMVLQEIELLRKTKHERIVNYFDSLIDDDNNLYLHMEYLPGGSLDTLLELSPLSEIQSRKMLKQILEGLAYLHSVPIVHRDLKCQNVLLTEDQEYIKLCDFGISKILNEATANVTTATDMVGTFKFMAPEIFDKKIKTTPASDIWSVGCVLIQMLTQNPPWGKITEMELVMEIAVRKTKPTYKLPENAPQEAEDILSACLKYEPTERPDVAALMQHPFLATND